MRRVVTLICGILALQVSAQETPTNPPVSNSNQFNYNVASPDPLEVLEEEAEQDSITVFEVEEESAKKKDHRRNKSVEIKKAKVTSNVSRVASEEETPAEEVKFEQVEDATLTAPSTVITPNTTFSAPATTTFSSPTTTIDYNASGSGAVDLHVAGSNSEVQTELNAASYGFTMSKSQATIQRSQRSPSLEQQMQMNQAVNYFEANSPESFEYHYFKYTAGNYDVGLIDNLRRAEELRPNNADVQVQLAAYNMITGNSQQAIKNINHLQEIGRLDESVMHYANDILISAPENGTLITHGFDDSYGTWYQQNVSNVREDVQLISLDFLQSEYYREELKKEGYKIPNRTTIDVQYLKEFCELNKDKALSISMTTPKEYFVPIQDKLYVTGVVFEYHEGEFNNFERNDELWNEDLEKHLVNNATDEKAKQLSANYLPMLLQLRRVYEQTENEEKLNDVDAASDRVGVQCKKYEQVQKLKKAYR